MKLALLFGRVFGVGLMLAANPSEEDDGFVIWLGVSLCFNRKNYCAALTSEGFAGGVAAWNGML